LNVKFTVTMDEADRQLLRAAAASTDRLLSKWARRVLVDAAQSILSDKHPHASSTSIPRRPPRQVTVENAHGTGLTDVEFLKLLEEYSGPLSADDGDVLFPFFGHVPTIEEALRFFRARVGAVKAPDLVVPDFLKRK
jgi:hypothetical protein